MIVEAAMRQPRELHQVDDTEPIGTLLTQTVGGVFNDPIVGLTPVVFYVSHRHSVQRLGVIGCTSRPHFPRAILEPRFPGGGGNISLHCRPSYMTIVI